jgi:hypothetical protein
MPGNKWAWNLEPGLRDETGTIRPEYRIVGTMLTIIVMTRAAI